MQISALTHDSARQQFYLLADGHKAFIDYTLEHGQYQLNHSEVPDALRGQGIGKVLVERTFAAIKDEGKTGFAHCSFIRHIATQSATWQGTISY